MVESLERKIFQPQPLQNKPLIQVIEFISTKPKEEEETSEEETEYETEGEETSEEGNRRRNRRRRNRRRN